MVRKERGQYCVENEMLGREVCRPVIGYRHLSAMTMPRPTAVRLSVSVGRLRRTKRLSRVEESLISTRERATGPPAHG